MAVIIPTSLQRDVQSSLPIIPNNGNPGGAYNMPQGQGGAGDQPPPIDPLAWLQPSEFMQYVHESLEEQKKRLKLIDFEQSIQQEKQLYNPVVRDGQWYVQPLDDYGLPILDPFTGQVIEYPDEGPNGLPVLPGE